MKKYDLVIFDMDGTILDTLEDLKNSLNYALKANNLPEHSLEEVRNFVGNGIHKLIERGVPKNTSDIQIEQVFNCFSQHYAIHCSDHTQAYKGIIPVIQKLRKEKIKTAIVSNKADFAVQFLTKQYFSDLFDWVQGAQKGITIKPAPDMVNLILQQAQISPERVVYIGDSEVDIQTAKNARINEIIVDWGFRKREYLIKQGAKTIVSNPEQLLETILYN